MLKRGTGTAVALLLVCVCSIVAAGAWAGATLIVQASFTPNELGAPTNLSASVTLARGQGTLSPVRNLVVYGPAGLGLNVRGLATCERTRLESDGPSGCPATSRVGFGGGVTTAELGGTSVRERYTLDLFLAPRERGRLAALVYVDALDPISLQFVLTAREVRAPRPYGLGLAVDVPPLPTIPGAANAAVESGYVSIGGANIAYYETIHGARKLVHVKGLLAPATCPTGGFPFEVMASFEDGTTSVGRYASPCPERRR